MDKEEHNSSSQRPDSSTNQPNDAGPQGQGSSGPEASTRMRILDAALHEFAAHGVAGARVDRIAKAAGVNKAMIYYHFDSKEELYHTILDEFFYDVISKIRREVGAESTLEARLRVLAEHYNEVFAKDRTVLRLMLRELANPDSPVPERVAGRMRETGLPQQLQAAFVDERQSGAVREVDGRQAMSSFIAMNIGFFMMLPIIQRVLEIEDLEQFIQERKSAVVDIFLHGVRTR
jgi:TetR/AcrR family transcriptional regulator